MPNTSLQEAAPTASLRDATRTLSTSNRSSLIISNFANPSRFFSLVRNPG
ncbi:hypothetical protein [Nostoc sp.]